MIVISTAQRTNGQMDADHRGAMYFRPAGCPESEAGG